MKLANDDLVVGERFEGVLLEVFRPESGSGTSRPRVRPVEGLPRGLFVQFPRRLREEHPIGTRFRADVKVCQRYDKQNGTPERMFLFATNRTIRLADNANVNSSVRAVRTPGSVSGRAYDYVFEDGRTDDESAFSRLRQAAYDHAVLEPGVRTVESSQKARSERVRSWARARANGQCEGCYEDAPFESRNGQPYLEVHHLAALSDGGADAANNVAALCPNCHSRIEHGKDGEMFNDKIRVVILQKEAGYPSR